MANIQPYINVINQAVFGEQVRGSITNALIAMNNELILGVGTATVDKHSDLPETGTIAVILNERKKHRHRK